MQSAPLELNFKHLADGQLGLLRTRMPLDCGASDPQKFKGSAIVARLNGEMVAELCTGAARFTRRPGMERQHGQVGLLWLLTGRCQVSQGSRKTLLDVGEWTVFDPAHDHEITIDERARVLLMWTSGQRFEAAAGGWQALAVSRIALAGPAQVALAAVGALLRSGSGLSAQSAVTLQEAVLGLVTRGLNLAMDSRGLARKPRETTVELKQLRAYVLENLARKDLGVDPLAEAFDISRRTVYKLFEPMAVTPHVFIQNARLDHALKLLGDAAWRSVPIAGIGRQCGFADPAHFSKAFRARNGVAPTVFRETATT